MINYMTMILQMNGGTLRICSQMKREEVDIGAFAGSATLPYPAYSTSTLTGGFIL